MSMAPVLSITLPSSSKRMIAPLASRPLMCAGTQAKAASPARDWLGCTLPPARGVTDGVQAFEQSVRGHRAAAEPAVALADRILQSQLDGVEFQPLGNFVKLRLGGECHLRVAKSAKGPEADLVGIEEATKGPHVGDPVRTAGHEQ